MVRQVLEHFFSFRAVASRNSWVAEKGICCGEHTVSRVCRLLCRGISHSGGIDVTAVSQSPKQPSLLLCSVAICCRRHERYLPLLAVFCSLARKSVSTQDASHSES